MNYFSRKNVYLVFGVGNTGISLISFLIKQGMVFYVSDDNIEKMKNVFVDGKKLEEKYKIYNINKKVIKEKKINILILSPSVHAQKKPHSVVVLSRKLNIDIIADIDLFYNYIQYYNKKNNTNKKIIAITGTNGKSTTTALTAFLFNKLKKSAIACGNIGLNVVSVDVDKYDYFIVEMSSYNLFLSNVAQFYSGILLNISEDHLDYHGTMNNYIKSKLKILKNSKIKIICIDDKYTFRLAKITHKDVSLKKIICVSKKQILKKGLSWSKGVYYYNGIKVFSGFFDNIPGEHNVENILCAVACVLQVNKIRKKQEIYDIFNNIKLFQGLLHRLQFVRKINNIIFVNDSKGTNADSTQKALNAFPNYEIYLIAGGQRKTAGFFFLKNDLKNVKYVFLIGEAMDSFSKELKELKINYKKCFNMKNAVFDALKEVKKNNNGAGKIILLSPLCASWDQYKNFEDRGNDFIKIVNSI